MSPAANFEAPKESTFAREVGTSIRTRLPEGDWVAISSSDAESRKVLVRFTTRLPRRESLIVRNEVAPTCVGEQADPDPEVKEKIQWERHD